LETNAPYLPHHITSNGSAVLQAEFRKKQKETAERAAKKVCLSAKITFKKKGNERQYHFNESVQEQFHVTRVRLEEVASFARALAGATCYGGRYALTKRLPGWQTAQNLYGLWSLSMILMN